MSTILKALRRLEEDKQASSPVALEEAIVAPRPARAAGAGPPWVGVLLVGVGLSLLFAAGFYAWPRGGSEPELASVPSLPTAPLETRDPRQTRDPRSTTRLRSQITRPTQPPTSAPTPPLVAETRTPAPPPEPEVARIERTPPA
ncbi:MAG: hypothetical protein O7A09_02865, partial [Proteobacteria bacterium]|nr:hypothetical protein [Pseudomonadota bacterium]